ncbi:MAG: DUF4349 domain-containing protein [Acidobacteria bacterium]|nr:DUF4349 domain-containing protein [Acidobacteriota bacterium]
MNKLSAIVFFTVSGLLLSGCMGAGDRAESPQFGAYDVASASNTAAPSAFEGERGTGSGGGGKEAKEQSIPLDGSGRTSQPAVPSERKIIRNADLSLESETPEEVQNKIAAIAESKGGFVIESQQRTSDRRSAKRDTVTMSVRVPAEKFAEAVDEIRKAAGRVLVETVKGQDVTEEFIDIEATLVAKRSLETQFLEIMKRANSVEDALNVQRQLSEVRAEIEKIEGRKRFLQDQASLSTIKVTIQTPAAISANSAGFFTKLTESINSGLDAATGFVLGLVTLIIALLPFLLFICLPLFFIIRYFWRKAMRRKMAEEIVREEIANEDI